MLTVLAIATVVALIVFWMWRSEGRQGLFVVFLSATAFLGVGSAIYYGAKDSLGSDKMILNGYVVSKKQEWTSCSHSYSCNCRLVSNGKTMSTQCDTCYEHSHDYDWVVRSTVGKTYIDRVDRQGSKEPERFKQIQLGEPFSIERGYFNYIKASPLSVFKDYNAYKDVEIPVYPKIFDYYRVKHTIDWKSQYKSGIQSIDKMLSEKLKVSSSKAKANVVVIFYGGSDDIVQATKVKNFGGRINDLTVMIRADKDGNIQNVGAFSWSKNDMVNVMVRDGILDLGQLNEENNVKLVDMLDNVLLKYYQHRDKEEFSYLEHNIQVSGWVYFGYFIIFVLIIGLNFFLTRK